MITNMSTPDEVEVAVCSLAELKGGRFTAWNDMLKDEVTVIQDGEAYRVFSSVCPHFGGEFDYDLNKKTAKCQWHAWEFDLKTGKCLTYPKLRTCLRLYPFEIKQGQIVVRASK